MAVVLPVRTNARFEEILGSKPERGLFINLSNQDTLQFLFNPEKLEEVYKSNYGRHSAAGLSHKRLQWLNNDNIMISFTAIFDQQEYNRRNGVGRQELAIIRQQGRREEGDVEDARRFLQAAHTPRRSTRLRAQSPAPYALVWPGVYETRVRFIETRIKVEMFQFAPRDPGIRLMYAQLSLEEDVAERLYADEVRTQGMFRKWVTRTEVNR